MGKPWSVGLEEGASPAPRAPGQRAPRSERFRTGFVLCAVEALSVGETAACLGVPEETVRTRFFRARRLLQTAIEAQLLSAGAGVYEFHLRRCDRVVHAVLARIARA
jgi:RNA polymerase sigma-70 factor (ECF subfamily)